MIEIEDNRIHRLMAETPYSITYAAGAEHVPSLVMKKSPAEI